MPQPLNLPPNLICLHCRSGNLEIVEDRSAIRCAECGGIFPVMNNVPCFVVAEQAEFSEVAPEKRRHFLDAKKLAYFSDSPISRMYNHYHEFAARKRRETGETPLTVDIGFGIGEHYRFITEAEKCAASFIGVDIDRFKLEHFSSLHPELPVLQGSALNLPFADSSVDVVQLLATLEHFPPGDLTAVVNEAVRILKPEGVLIVSYPSEGGLLLKVSQKIMHYFIRVRSGFDLELEEIHLHHMSAGALQLSLRSRHDLQRVESRYYPFALRSLHLSLFINETYVRR